MREEQIEALQVLYSYNQRALKELKEVAEEFSGNKKEDTDEYLIHILKGVNWEIQVVNGTMDLINENEMIIDKEKINKSVVELNDSIVSKDDERIYNVLKNDIIPFLELIDEISLKYQD